MLVWGSFIQFRVLPFSSALCLRSVGEISIALVFLFSFSLPTVTLCGCNVFFLFQFIFWTTFLVQKCPLLLEWRAASRTTWWAAETSWFSGSYLVFSAVSLISSLNFSFLSLHVYKGCLLFLFFFFSFWLHRRSCRILVPPPGTEPVVPAMKAWILNHWTTTLFPPLSIYLLLWEVLLFWSRHSGPHTYQTLPCSQSCAQYLNT